jgi:outer membrane protein OmpA-like peptidoglycan-associated protein
MKTQNALRRHRTVVLGIFLALVIIESKAQTPVLLFEKNSYELTALTRSRLDAVIKSVKQGNAAEEIALIGHTDGDAADEYNKTLSFNRATAVRQYMQSQGVNNRIHIESKGETQLLAKETDENQKGKNRRVEIIRNYSRNNFAFDAFQKVPEVFTLNTKRDTLITCKGGTQVKI